MRRTVSGLKGVHDPVKTKLISTIFLSPRNLWAAASTTYWQMKFLRLV